MDDTDACLRGVFRTGISRVLFGFCDLRYENYTVLQKHVTTLSTIS